MTEASLLPLLTTELAQRLIAAERDCMVDWLRAMEALDGNPFGISVVGLPSNPEHASLY